MDCQEIAGNGEAKDFLRKLLGAGQRPHAILLAGPEGIGKRRLAASFAAALLCGQQAAPCGQCESCRRFKKNNHPDCFVVQKTPDSREESIGIEQVRSLIKEAAFAPRLSANRAVLLIGLELFTAEAANSLLKLLEEPPDGWVFIMTASAAELLLPTILSRVVVIKMRPPAAEEIAPCLENAGLTRPAALTAAALADGALGRALLYAAPEALACREQAVSFLRQALAGDKEGLLSEGLEKIDRANALLLCEFVAVLARDAWRLRLGGADRIWLRDSKDDIAGLFAALSIEQLENVVRDAQTAWSAVKNAASARLALEGLYVALAGIKEDGCVHGNRYTV